MYEYLSKVIHLNIEQYCFTIDKATIKKAVNLYRFYCILLLTIFTESLSFLWARKACVDDREDSGILIGMCDCD